MDLKTKAPMQAETLTGREAGHAAGVGTVAASLEWQEARFAYPIYSALAKQLRMGPGAFDDGTELPEDPSPEVRARVLQWLDEIDANAKAYQIRQLPLAIFNHSEPALRALIQRHLGKPTKSATDRDKIDFLLVQYFALCAPDSMYHQDVSLEDARRVLEPVLDNVNAQTPPWCEALDTIVAHLKNADSLRDLLQTGYLKEARGLKEGSGEKFYQPEALLTFVRFNFLMRRSFIRLLHCDQRAIARSLDQLQKAGVQTVDCTLAGLSAAEPVAQVRQFVQGWRSNSHLDYSAGVVVRSFEQLLALRADLEAAAHQVNAEAKQTQAEYKAELVEAAKPGQSAEQEPSNNAAGAATAPVTTHLSDVSTGASTGAAPDSGAESGGSTWSKEECANAITGQLKATPSTASRPMSTVTLKGTKLLLSSWELSAFHSGASGPADSVRQAVAARAMLAIAIDEFKKSNAVVALKAAIETARGEVPQFQKMIEDAKTERHIEAAVNLNISVKRLSAFLSEAEKLAS